ncbi:GerMN domain-containing protein [Micromonospora sp. M51]|uniref:GerMN domain-containing protein n=1 Tax=Micromonospora parva TaxID=1464048 RepID=A0ABW6VRD1_9ACTN|nr:MULTISPECIES: GerMN domain-containing protein [unclassified Micromonospora]MBQ1015554.1 GerMN domain-containing protein [Micromonospora sp. M51]MBQ1028782.1 GerMN domain-containing protein [Micromonospora sp. C97]
MKHRHLVVLAVAASLTGCSIPTDDAPRVVQAPQGPFQSSASADTSAPVGPAAETLCFVRDNRIISFVRRVDRPPTVEEQLRHLLAGPTAAERDTDLTTALAGAVNAAGVTVTGTEARVVVDKPGEDAGRSDEVLAFGQIVCTLTSRDDVTTVTFSRDGRPLRVPRADGSLSEQPLTRVDFAPLIAPR